MEAADITMITEEDGRIVVQNDHKMVNYFGKAYSLLMDFSIMKDAVKIQPGKVYKGRDPRMLLVTSGEAEVLFNGSETLLKTNVLLYTPEYYTIEFVRISADFNARVLIFPLESVVGADITPLYGQIYRLLSEKEVGMAEMYFKLLDTMRDMPEDFSNTAKKTIGSFVDSLYTLNRVHKSDSGSQGGMVLREFLRLLKQHVTHERRVAFYAGQLGRTPNYLNILVKTESGKSCKEWIGIMLTNKAKELLDDMGKSLREISGELGFYTAAQFGTYFKKETGKTPMEYRNGIGM